METGGAPLRRVITAPSLRRARDEFLHPSVIKRGSKDLPINPRVRLERVLGLTVTSNAALHSDPQSQTVAYPAGCVVVLLEEGGRGRERHLVSGSRKTVTCVGYSNCGRYLATGEVGHCPSLRVWDLSVDPPTVAADLPGHKHSINCLAFSPSQKYIVSVGSQQDMIVNVWDWRAGMKTASNKVSSKVKAVSFSEDGSYFVTVGNRHVKFWYLEYSRGSKYKEPVPLMGRSAILGEQRNNDFVDVGCGRGQAAPSTFAITKSGLLCEFNSRRLLDKWVELRTVSANCLAVGESRVFVGCAQGIVRCFDPLTLQFVTTLPRTHHLGVDLASCLHISHMASHPDNAKYPDTVAITFDEKNAKLTCVYNDHSLYIWDVRDIKRVGKSQSSLYHSGCIWGLEMFPPGLEFLPDGSFVTCSSDDTIRVWNSGDSRCTPGSPYQRNVYSRELLKVLYLDNEGNGSTTNSGGRDGETTEEGDGRAGVRCLALSPGARHLASGDRAGNVRVHCVENLAELCLIEAHDAEVLALEYSPNNPALLASASRDRLLHVFNVEQDYNFLQTLDDHSSSITAVRFIENNEKLQMVSCGADKSIIFREMTSSGGDSQASNVGEFVRVANLAGKATLYDMAVDSGQRHVLTACHDRNIRVYSVNSAKHTRTFKASLADDGSLIKVCLDPSGLYLASSCTDKSVCIYDYYSGECVAMASGHSELVTSLKFSSDCERLVSASGDGTILVWTLPHDMVVTMRARLQQQQARNRKANKLVNGNQSDQEDFYTNSKDIFDTNANKPGYSVLPVWAKKELEGVDPGTVREVTPPRGRWAQRVDSSSFSYKSYQSDSYLSLSSPVNNRVDSDGSKEDSSVDSGAETGRSSLLSNLRREEMNISKSQDSTGDFLSCPESLHEILSADDNKVMSGSNIRLNRGSDISSDMSNVGKLHHHTDDSSLGSFKYEVESGEEGDGDVEDCSEGETRPVLYVEGCGGSDSGRDYPVARPASADMLSESDSDDTAGCLSASSDRLDRLTPNLINNYHSLANRPAAHFNSKGKRSLSSQHQVSSRNTNVIEAAQSTRNDADAMRKREELMRRIEETKKQLQKVGFRSKLKNSQSIQDLSIARQGGGLSLRPHVPNPDCVGGSMRRSCSLSDLVAPHSTPLRPPKTPKGNSSFLTPHTMPRYASNKSSPSSMVRSSSVGILNQSDSEGEGRLSRVMRPTISSQNKIQTKNNTNNQLARRLRHHQHSHSTMNLSREAGHTEDSSSEENQVTPETSKPVPPPRPKSCVGLPTGSPGRRGTDLRRSASAIVRPKSAAVVASVGTELATAADAVAQLHRRLAAATASDGTEADRILSGLTAAITRAQTLLHDL